MGKYSHLILFVYFYTVQHFPFKLGLGCLLHTLPKKARDYAQQQASSMQAPPVYFLVHFL